MRKYIFLVVGVLMITSAVYSQSVVAITENFDGNTSVLTASPATAWKKDTNYYMSLPNSIRGIVPNMAGDSTVLITQVYDFTNYSNVLLQFSHICKVSPQDVASVEYRTEVGAGVMSAWIPLPAISYLGKASPNHYDMYGFNANSYSEWRGNDSLALPLSVWWKEETFDLQSEAGQTLVQFRFIIRHGVTPATQISYGWLIDNVEIIASNHLILPPVVEFIGAYPKDIMYNVVPYVINAKVRASANAQIYNPYLIYTSTLNGISVTDSVIMEHVAGDSLWKATLPSFSLGTSVFYSITGKDTAGRQVTIHSSYIVRKPSHNYGSVSAALTSITSPSQGLISGNTTIPIGVILHNPGDSALTSATIYWSVNGVESSYSWTGNLPWDTKDTISLGTYHTGMEQYDTIVIWVSNPNGLSDPALEDDTLSIITYGCSTSMAGTYIVGTGEFFSTLQEALTALKLCYSVGDVILKLKNGTYPGNVNLSNSANFIGNHSLTITSLTNNKDSVILRSVSGAGVLMNNSNNIRIENITIDATQGTFGIEFTGGGSNIVVNNCAILANPTATANTSAGIYRGLYTLGDFNDFTVSNCTINGGYSGIYLFGIDTNYAQNIIIDSNIISNSCQYGIYLYYVDVNSLSYNQVTNRSANQGTAWYAIDLYYAHHGGNIVGNRVRTNDQTTSDLLYGLYLTYVDSVLIANNEIYLHTSGLIACGMYSHNQGTANYLHNTVLLTGEGRSGGISAAVFIGFAATPYEATYKNNLFVANGGKTLYAVYCPNAPAAGFEQYNHIDYNNYYSSGNLGYAGRVLVDLADWKSVIVADTHSINILPPFVDVSKNFELSDYIPFYCNLIHPVTTDILDSNRRAVTTMGCYEEVVPNGNGALEEILGLRKDVIIDDETDNVKVVFTNMGSTPLNSVDIKWSVNDVSQTPISHSFLAPLIRLQSDTIDLGMITYSSGNFDLKIWIHSLNGGAIQDESLLDDTVSISIFVCSNTLTGIISVSDTSVFSTITAAIQAISTCGIGDITLMLDSGKYEENCDLSNLNSYIMGNTVTITSKTGKAEDVIIKPVSGVGVTLSNTRNLVLKALTVDATSGTYAIQFTGACSNIVVRDCRLLASPTTTSTTNAPVYKAAETGVVDSIFFINNLLDGGYYGFYFNGGLGLSVNQYGTHVLFDSNTVSNQYYSGTYPEYVDFISCSYNTFLSRTAQTNATWYALRMYYSNGAVVGNKILQRSSLIDFPCGIYTVYHNYYPLTQVQNRGLIANNEIIISSTMAYSSTYKAAGIYAENTKCEIIHNSIYLTGGLLAGGIYITNSANNDMVIKNNNIVIADELSIPVYFNLAGNPALYDMDYNNLYGTAYIGSYGGLMTTMAAWQQATGKDLHSISIMPAFLDPTFDLELSNYDSVHCPLISTVNTDIREYNRTTTTTMGCYEEVLKSGNGALVEALGLRKGTIIDGETDNLEVVFSNKGTTPLNTVHIGWSVNGVSQTPKTFSFGAPLARLQSDTLNLGVLTYTSGNFNLKIWINSLDGGNIADEFSLNDTITASIFVCSDAITGIIPVSDTSVFTTIMDAIDAVLICGVGEITLVLDSGKYEENCDFTNLNTYMKNNLLTITSKTGKAEDVVIKPVSGAGISLYNTHNLILKAITVDVSSGTEQAIRFVGTCTNIVVRDCRLLANPTTTNALSAPVYKGSNTGQVDSIFFIHNLLDGGYSGFYFSGGFDAMAGRGTHIVFDSNVVSNQYYYGIYPEYADFISCSYNTVLSRTTNAGANWYALRMYVSHGAVIGNRIIQRSAAITTPYGIYSYVQNLNYTGFVRNRALIANNEIILNITGTGYGIYISDSRIELINNSVYISGTGAARGIQIQNSTNNDMVIKNNNIVLTSSSAYPVYFSAPGNLNLYDIDYNNLYAPAFIGYYGTDIKTMEAWRQFIHTDRHSVNILKTFIDTDSLEPTDYTGLKCNTYPSVATDIRGNSRETVTVMGCYGEPVTSVNAALVSILGLQNAIHEGDKDNIQVVFSNTGSTTIDSVNIEWAVDGVSLPQKNVVFASTLVAGQQDTVLLGEITYQPGINTVQVWINKLNAGLLVDEFIIDDTIMASAYTCPDNSNGVITISDTSSYHSIEQVMEMLSYCNLSSDITLVLDTGVYEESLSIIDVNLSMNYSLTITSISGNPKDVILRSPTGIGAIIGNSNNIRIENITIDAIQGMQGIQLASACTNIVINNCIILVDPAATTATCAGIYKATNTGSLVDMSITNTMIKGGYYGIYLFGTSSNYCQNITIDSNVISDQYLYGTYLYYVDLNSFSYNRITPRASAQGTTWTGAYFYYARNGGKIIGNRISSNNSGINNTLQGMYAYYMDSALVANNEIYLNSSASTTYGLYVYYPKGLNCVHNTVLVTGSGGSTFRAANLNTSTSASYDATYKNNIFVANGGTTPYAVYLTLNPANYLQYNPFDYNNYYSSGNLGYAGGDRANLAAWKSVVTTDTHSVNISPAFTNVANNLQLSNYAGLLCPSFPEVTRDIDGYYRTDITNMGAYSNSSYLDLGIRKVICRETEVLYPQTVPVEIEVIRTGNAIAIDSATFGWSINGVVQPSYTWIASGALDVERNTEVSIGAFNAGRTSIFNLVVWIESVNGQKDIAFWNDTASTIVNVLCTGDNLSVQSIEQLTPDGVLCTEDYTSLNVNLENTGTSDYDFALNPVSVSVRVTNPVAFSLDTVVSTGKIKSGEIATLELTDMFPTAVAGQYDIKIWIDSTSPIIYDDTLAVDYISGKFGLPVDEDFSHGIPLVFVSNGLNTYYKWDTVSQGTGADTGVFPQFGAGMLAFGGSVGSMTVLSTLQLDLSRTVQPALSFWYFHDTIPCEDYTDVRITTDGGTTYNTLFSLTKYNPVYGWRQYSMDLPPRAVNECVILVFEAMEKSRNGNVTQYIDRILITARQDIAVTNIITSEYSVCDLQNKNVKVVLSNLTDPILDFVTTPTTLTLEIKETGQTYTHVLDSGSLGRFASDTITVATGVNFTKGTYTLKAYFSSVLDVDRMNDTLVIPIIINPALSVSIQQESGGNTNCLSGELVVHPTITLYNTGNMDLSNIDMILQVDTGENNPDVYVLLKETYTNTIHAGDTATYMFNSSYSVPWNARYDVRTYTYLSCDSAMVNSTNMLQECVDIKDLRIISIDNPSVTMTKDAVGSSIPVTVTLNNRSDGDIFTDIPVNVRITNSQGIEQETFMEPQTIGASATVSHVFTRTYTVPNDTVYYLTVFVNSQDNYRDNDTLTMKRYTESVGIETWKDVEGFTLSQNIPNPANNRTRIDYSIPEAGEVVFNVHSVSGQLLYSQTIEANNGKQSLELNTNAFAAGIYFYSIEYKGQRLVKRMIVQ